jgi:hypothetical protein
MTQRSFGESNCPVDNFLSPLAHLKGRGFMMVLVLIGGAIALTGLVWGLLALEERFTAQITHSEGEWGYL